MNQKNQFPVEIHTHTNHSDGSFTPRELLTAAKAFGYKGIILTDHNSSSGYNEMVEDGLLDNNELVVMKGMEWTTYYGHMLVHDADYDVDWREAGPDTIDTHMREVREADGLIGIAHPYDMGSPICTGCHWDYHVRDYSLVHYIEVWNSNQPQKRLESEAAYQFWLRLLRDGFRVSASAGRDWHRPDQPSANMGVTYLEIENTSLSEDRFKHALENGHFYITLGPTVEFYISNGEKTFHAGDQAEKRWIHNQEAFFSIAPADIEQLKQFPVNDYQLTLWNNDKAIYRTDKVPILDQEKGYTFVLPDELDSGVIRYEVTGNFDGEEDVRIVIGNPIYVL